MQGGGGCSRRTAPLDTTLTAHRHRVQTPPPPLGEKCNNTTDSFWVTSSCPFHKSPSLCSVDGSWNWITFWNWSPCLTRARQSAPLPLPTNQLPGWNECTLCLAEEHSAASVFPVSPQDAGFLLAYKSGFCHHTDKSLLSFNSNCIIP